MLIFFDGILIYNSHLQQHTSHLQDVLHVLRNNPLFIKLSKFSFVGPLQLNQWFCYCRGLLYAPVLALAQFTKPFVVEIDALAIGMGVILMKGSHAIAYINKTLSKHRQGLSAYEKEFLTVLFVVKK